MHGSLLMEELGDCREIIDNPNYPHYGMSGERGMNGGWK